MDYIGMYNYFYQLEINKKIEILKADLKKLELEVNNKQKSNPSAIKKFKSFANKIFTLWNVQKKSELNINE